MSVEMKLPKIALGAWAGETMERLETTLRQRAFSRFLIQQWQTA